MRRAQPQARFCRKSRWSPVYSHLYYTTRQTCMLIDQFLKKLQQMQTGIIKFANLCQMHWIVMRKRIRKSSSTSNLSETDLKDRVENLASSEGRIEKKKSFLDKVKLKRPQATEDKAQLNNIKHKQHSPNCLKDSAAEVPTVFVRQILPDSLGVPCKDATGSNTSSSAHFGQHVCHF